MTTPPTAPPRKGLVWNGQVWFDPPTGRVWREGPPREVIEQHLGEIARVPEPTEFDRTVARLLQTVLDLRK